MLHLLLALVLTISPADKPPKEMLRTHTDAPAAAADVPAVVSLEVFDPAGNLYGSVAAFIVEPGHIVTNRHCVDFAGAAFVNLGAAGLVPVRGIIVDDEDADIVVLTADLPAGAVRPLAWAEEWPAPRTPLRLLVRDDDGQLRESRGRALRRSVREGKPALITDVPAWLGCSGSPLLDDQGRVVGVINRLEGDTVAYGRAVPSAYLRGVAQRPELALDAWLKDARVASAPNAAASAALHALHAGNIEEALSLARAALQDDAADPRALRVLASGMLAQGKAEEAGEELQRWRRRATMTAKSWGELGLAQLTLRDYARAIVSLENSLRERPDAEVCLWLGLAQERLGAPHSAMMVFLRTLELEPAYPEALNALECYAEAHGWKEAIVAVFVRTAESDPGDVSLAQRAAVGAAASGDRETAERLEAAVRAISPSRANRIRAALSVRESLTASSEQAP